VLLVVLGLGAVVEIVEYFVVLTVAHQGVGDYHNNLQDLVANLVGASTHLLVRQGLDGPCPPRRAAPRRGRRRVARAPAQPLSHSVRDIVADPPALGGGPPRALRWLNAVRAGEV
jgi:hypothetical protein